MFLLVRNRHLTFWKFNPIVNNPGWYFVTISKLEGVEYWQFPGAVAVCGVCRARFVTWSPTWNEQASCSSPAGKDRIASSGTRSFPAR